MSNYVHSQTSLLQVSKCPLSTSMHALSIATTGYYINVCHNAGPSYFRIY